MSAREPGSGGLVAALPLSAGFTVQLARTLPIRFEYRENALGIASIATRERYPLQQETFWLLFAALAGALIAWVLARLLRRACERPRTQAAVEGLGALGLVLALWLPGAAGALGCGASALLALVLARRRGAREAPLSAPAAEDRPRPRPRTPPRALALVALAGLASALLTPQFWTIAWIALHRVPDDRLVANTFLFLAEAGQHLAWADAILRGELHGRDFFCLYGPLYDLGLAGFWALTGRSIAGWKLYSSLSNVLAYAAALLLCGALLRRRAFVLALPMFLFWPTLRIGLGLAGLLCLVAWRRTGRRRGALAAGLVAGTSLAYSQEFGLALLLTASLGLLCARDARAAALFAAGLAAALAPVLGWFALRGALGPMLSDLVAYPTWVIAGYAKLPFPSLAKQLPLELAALQRPGSLGMRLAYSAAAVYAAGLLLGLRLGALRARHPLRWLRAAADSLASDPLRFGAVLVAAYGALSFRYPLGRSDVAHIMTAIAPGAVLLVVAADRLAAAWLADRARRLVVATRAAALLVFVLHAGAVDPASPFELLRHSIREIASLARQGYEPVGSAHVQEVASWVRSNTEEGEPVLFLPNDAAYYYLTRRPSPIRFVLGHQMVTDAHRAEALAALRARPPRAIVWDHGVLKVDGIPDRDVFGPEFLAWVDGQYREATRIGRTSILRRIDRGW